MSAAGKKQLILALVLMTIGGLLGAVLSGAMVTAQSNVDQQAKPSSPAIVQKWDYRVISGNPRTVEQDLQTLGNQGYEAAGFEAQLSPYGDGSQLLSVLLRRPKP